MHRVLWTWRGVTVYSYPALLYVGVVLGLAAGNLAAHAAGVDAGAAFAATLLLLGPALVGARLLFVAANWPVYRREPWRIWRRAEGGATLYGGLLVAVAISPPLLASLHLPFGAFWDVATVTMLVGMICTRVGCLLNGCCAGRPSDHWLALRLPDADGVWRRRLPTQLFEVALAAALLAGVVATWGHRPFAGAAFLAVAGSYGLGRLALESLRAPESASSTIVYRAISAALVAAALVTATLVAVIARWPR